MQTTTPSFQTLPPGYTETARFNIKSRATLIALNLAGLVLVLLSTAGFTLLALHLRPEAANSLFAFQWEGVQFFFALAVLLLVIFITLVLHEAIHGLGFIALARVKPVFAFRGAYAYAAAPGWYIPIAVYFWIGVAPLIVLSLLAVLLLATLPVAALSVVVLAAVMNASGAVGDIWVAILLLRQPRGSLALDNGDEISFYAPRPATAG
ncbi:MAG: DUF3267 domain-containing protein [Chloroflexota bacterium]|jgi:hypothetical protein